MNWISRHDRLPEHNQYVLAFSPEYRDDHVMRWRTMSGQFFKACEDATHWLPLEEAFEDEVHRMEDSARRAD